MKLKFVASPNDIDLCKKVGDYWFDVIRRYDGTWRIMCSFKSHNILDKDGYRSRDEAEFALIKFAKSL